MSNGKARFPLGQTVITPGALEAIEAAEQDPSEFLIRHMTGDYQCLVCTHQ